MYSSCSSGPRGLRSNYSRKAARSLSPSRIRSGLRAGLRINHWTTQPCSKEAQLRNGYSESRHFILNKSDLDILKHNELCFINTVACYCFSQGLAEHPLQ